MAQPVHRGQQHAAERQRAECQAGRHAVDGGAGDLGQQLGAVAAHRQFPQQRPERRMHSVLADQCQFGVAGRAQQRGLDMHHAQAAERVAHQLAHGNRAVHQPLVREHRQGHHVLAVLEVDRDPLGVAHARGEDLQHFGGAAIGLEAVQVGAQRGAERRDARTHAAARGLGLQLFQVKPVGAGAHQLGFTEGDRGLKHGRQDTGLGLYVTNCSQRFDL